MTVFNFTLRYKVIGDYSADDVTNILYKNDLLQTIVGSGVEGVIAVNILTSGLDKQEEMDRCHKIIMGMNLGLELID